MKEGEGKKESGKKGGEKWGRGKEGEGKRRGVANEGEEEDKRGGK